MFNIGYQVLLVVLAASAASTETVDYHETLDDHFDFNPVMADRELLREHLDCYLDRGPCTELMLSYKQHLPSVISEACAKCNPPQKHLLRVWIDGLEKVDPQGFEDYKRTHDPDNIYITPLRAAIAGY